MTPPVSPIEMYPLRFEPIYQYRLWGGRALAEVLEAPLPSGPIGEAWILSDRDDHASRVAAGPLAGWSLSQILEKFPTQILGGLARSHQRFPLLLKFLDARQMLSVQVHPSDAHPELLPAGETGKTEAWVVLSSGNESRIYAGLKPGTTPQALRDGLACGQVTDHLACFTPEVGDAVFLPAGTVHSLGGDLVVFEIQQNSDVTFRLYDWEHVDTKTGQLRPLQVESALACIDYAAGPVIPQTELTGPGRVALFDCAHFSVWRVRAHVPFKVGVPRVGRVLVCIDGSGEIESAGATYPVRRGDVVVLPAAIGVCAFRPTDAVTLLEIALPEATANTHAEAQR